MKYINKRTRVVFDSSRIISGGDWVPFEQDEQVTNNEPKPEPVEEPKPVAQPEVDLDEMSFVDLKEYAAELGLDTKGLRSKEEVRDLIKGA